MFYINCIVMETEVYENWISLLMKILPGLQLI